MDSVAIEGLVYGDRIVILRQVLSRRCLLMLYIPGLRRVVRGYIVQNGMLQRFGVLNRELRGNG
jgi:hypothetical protein